MYLKKSFELTKFFKGLKKCGRIFLLLINSYVDEDGDLWLKNLITSKSTIDPCALSKFGVYGGKLC